MTKTEDYEKLEITSPTMLNEWLSENHSQAESMWLVTFKSDQPEKYVSREKVLDELVAFGWIDGIRRKLDAKRTMQLISPRKTQHWAKSYKDRAARLIKEGRMSPPGLKSIDEGKTNGLWNFMDDVDALIIPDDLKTALQGQNPALENFETSAPSYQRNVLRWLKLAKTAKTRTSRIEKIADFAARNEKIPQM